MYKHKNILHSSEILYAVHILLLCSFCLSVCMCCLQIESISSVCFASPPPTPVAIANLLQIKFESQRFRLLHTRQYHNFHLLKSGDLRARYFGWEAIWGNQVESPAIGNRWPDVFKGRKIRLVYVFKIVHFQDVWDML